jgi:hypothetical protein
MGGLKYDIKIWRELWPNINSSGFLRTRLRDKYPPCDRPPGGRKKAWWLGSTRTKQSFTFTPDIGEALVRLASKIMPISRSASATAKPAPNRREWLDLYAEAAGRMPRHLNFSGRL